MSFDYDLFVMGSGPAGHAAAIQAAKLGKRVVMAEQRARIGGASVNTGTIPSKTLREAALHLTGFRERSIYGASYRVKHDITMEDLLFRTEHVIKNEIDVTRDQLQRNDVELLEGRVSFVDPHTIHVAEPEGRRTHDITADKIVIGTGTTTTKDEHIPFDDQKIFTSDELLGLEEMPKTLAVAGAGVVGCEYATIFAALGVRVTLIDKRARILEFVDGEVIDSLVSEMRRHRMTLRLREQVNEIVPFDDDMGEHVRITLESGKTITADKVLYSIGRTGATAALNLDAVGLAADERGRLTVNQDYQTSVPHIYAAGDVIGFPSLAFTSMEQGRLASCHAFGVNAESVPELFPYGIYTIPEISIVGRNEEELTDAKVPYEVGKAMYREISRGQIIGDSTGLLKLLFHTETREILGVNIVGEGASELIHVGQAVMALGGTIDYFINTVFNYPTLAECYKTAAFDGINRLR